MWMKIALAIILTTLAECSHFRGAYITWAVNQTDESFYPADPYAANLKVHVNFGTSWRRSDGSSYCTEASIASCQFFSHGSWIVYSSQNNFISSKYEKTFQAGYYCQRFSSTSDFTLGYNEVVLTLSRNASYKLKSSSCCWIYGLQRGFSSTSWNVEAVMDFKDLNSSSTINTPPQIESMPLIQHKYEAIGHYRLPVYDTDPNDRVECRWAANSNEGGGVYSSRLNSAHLAKNCTLTIYGYNPVGWYALAVIVEDYAYDYPSSGYVRKASVPLQFTVNVHSSNATKIYGSNDQNCTSSLTVNVSLSTTLAPFTTTASSISSNKATSDGCVHYQVLSEADRQSTYYDSNRYRCDKELFGWYRFMGQAGNRMATMCPRNLGGYSYRCGTNYQGWMINGSLPTVSDGIVNRVVCFSYYTSCSCSTSKTVMMKNCGSFYVYLLYGVPYCNSRYCGVKDKTSSVFCTKNSMSIELDRRYYNTSLFSKITLRDAACSASYSSTKITLGSAPGTCGAIKQETSSHVVYENEVILKAKTTHSLISREHDQRVKFTCYYSKNGYVASVGYLPVSNITGYEVGYGNFSFNFVMYTDHTYSVMHTHYPVTVNLRDWMYLEVYSHSSYNNSTVVLVDQCFSTPTMDRNHYLKYTLINNRCPVDSTVQFHKTQRNRQRFSLQAFKFLANSTAVYLHCYVFLCHSTSTDSRCRYGCQGNNIYRVKRDAGIKPRDEPSKMYMLDLQIRRKEELNKNSKEMNRADTSRVVVFVLCGFAFLAIFAIVGLAVKLKQVKKRGKVGPNMRADRYENSNENLPSGNKPMPAFVNDDINLQQCGVINKEEQDDIFKY